MKTVPIVNPPPKDAVEEDNCFAGAKKLMDPFAPLIRKAVTPKNKIEAIQVNTVECLVEVKFQNKSSAQNKSRLISANEIWNMRL
jgi:hypothetical protein